MPELPEVETIRRGLGEFILNKKIVQVKVDTEKSFVGGAELAQVVVGATVTELRRRGKALLIDLDNGLTMMIHLRMTGQLIWRGAELDGSGVLEDRAGPNGDGALKKEAFRDAAHANFAAGHPSKNFIDQLPNAQTRATFGFSDGRLFFNDQRKFGFVKVIPTDEVEQDNFIASLAKEPWGMDVKELFSKCQRHARAPIKAVLLDQKVIAGLGNIYADETLFYAGIHPETLAGDLTEEEVGKILEGACRTMQASIDSGGSTMATYVKADGTTGNYLELFAQVFRREGQPCQRCGTEIVKIRVAGRGTHICPHCQIVKGPSARDALVADTTSSADALLALRTSSTACSATPASSYYLATSASRSNSDSGSRALSPTHSHSSTLPRVGSKLTSPSEGREGD